MPVSLWNNPSSTTPSPMLSAINEAIAASSTTVNGYLGGADFEATSGRVTQVLVMIPSSSKRKVMGVVAKLADIRDFVPFPQRHGGSMAT